MGIFDWLLGRNKRTEVESSTPPVKETVDSKPRHPRDIQDSQFNSKETIVESSSVKLIRKQLRETKKVSGAEGVVSEALEIFTSNVFLFDDCISLIKQVIPSMKKLNDWSNDDVLKFVQKQVVKCPEKLDTSMMMEVAYACMTSAKSVLLKG